MDFSKQIPWYHYFISQYSYTIIVICFFLVFLPTIIRVDHPHIRSHSTSNHWSSESDPMYFLHLSDTHISRRHQFTSEILFKSFKYAEQISASAISITGDIVDNDPSQGGHQCQSDWDLFNDTIAQFTIPTVDTAGNHDAMRAFRYDPDSFLFPSYHSNYTNVTKEAFQLSYHNVQDLSFHAMNPFSFPQMGTRLGLFAYIPPQIIPQLKSQLQSTTENQFFLNHFPANLIDSPSFENMLSQSNIKLALAGHTHPITPTLKHYGDVLEITGPSLKYSKSFGLVALDNGRTSYHHIKMSAKAICTHPIPLSQYSGQVDFSEMNTEVRVLFFGNETASFHVTGAVTGQLVHQREIKPNVNLYSMPLNLTYGKHQITISGDLNTKIDFYIGNKVTLDREYLSRINRLKVYLIVLVCFIFVFALFELIPIPLPEDAHAVNEYLQGGPNVPTWKLFVFGGLARKARIGQAPFITRLVFIILFVLSVIVPTAFSNIQGHVVAIWPYGFLADGKNSWNLMSLIFTVCFVAIVLYPPLFILSALPLSVRFHTGFIVDLVIYGVTLLGVIATLAALIEPAVMALGAILNFCFVITPIGLIILLFITRRQMLTRAQFTVLTEDAAFAYTQP